MLNIFAEAASNTNSWQDTISFVALLAFMAFFCWLLFRNM